MCASGEGDKSKRLKETQNIVRTCRIQYVKAPERQGLSDLLSNRELRK